MRGRNTSHVIVLAPIANGMEITQATGRGDRNITGGAPANVTVFLPPLVSDKFYELKQMEEREKVFVSEVCTLFTTMISRITGLLILTE